MALTLPMKYWALIEQDNWLHAYGDLQSEQGKAIKAELRRVMYPEFDDWKTMIWNEAVDALDKVRQGAERLGRRHPEAMTRSGLWHSPPERTAHRGCVQSDTTQATYRR